MKLSWRELLSVLICTFGLGSVLLNQPTDTTWAQAGYPMGNPGTAVPPANVTSRLHLPYISSSPRPSTSWYRINGTDSVSDAEGCSAATNGVADQIVVLDLGAAWTSTYQGVTYYGVRFLNFVSFQSETVSLIEGTVESYISGFSRCRPANITRRVMVIVGLNHSGDQAAVTYQHGREWALMLVRMQSWVNSNGFNSFASLAAGMDYESDFGLYSLALNWTNGYFSASQHPLFNFGTCNFCEYTDNSGITYAQGFSNGWSQDAIWNVSAGFAGSRTIPEIYVTASSDKTPVNARQWGTLAKWARTCTGGCLPAQRQPDPNLRTWIFSGPMTQQGACIYADSTPTTVDDCSADERNSPATGFGQLSGVLQGTRDDDYLWYATDIDWQR